MIFYFQAWISQYLFFTEADLTGEIVVLSVKVSPLEELMDNSGLLHPGSYYQSFGDHPYL